MHLGENTIPIAQAALYGAASAAVVAMGVRKYYSESQDRLDYKIMSGVFAAFVFTATIFEFPLPFGSCEHPVGTPLVSIFMGPLVTAFLSVVVLLMELLFREGTILTLGANVFSLGIVGGLVGWGTFYILRKFKAGFFIAGFAAGFFGDLCVYFTTSVQLTLGQLQGKSFWYYFSWFVGGQIPLAIIEGLFTGLVLMFIFARRPEMLKEYNVN